MVGKNNTANKKKDLPFLFIYAKMFLGEFETILTQPKAAKKQN
jgi:hypothetical protein